MSATSTYDEVPPISVGRRSTPVSPGRDDRELIRIVVRPRCIESQHAARTSRHARGWGENARQLAPPGR